jgi:hypothetical protein
MAVSARDCVAMLLADYAPASLLVIGDPPAAPETDAELTCVSVHEVAAELAVLGRFDFAIVTDLLEALDAPTAEVVLGRLKNLHTDKYLLLADPARACLGHDALLALALAPCEQLDDGRIAWRYDIDRYNPERPWNNPDDWANPQNFDRFRW